jgi:hypothetical protein
LLSAFRDPGDDPGRPFMSIMISSAIANRVNIVAPISSSCPAAAESVSASQRSSIAADRASPARAAWWARLARDRVRLAKTENKAKKKLAFYNNVDFNVTRARWRDRSAPGCDEPENK